MEAIRINLTGEMAQHYDVYYRVHAQSYGWLDWAKNGESAGTEALSKRLEAIEIKLVEKGGLAPGPTTKPFIKSGVIITNNNYNLTLANALNYQMKVSPQTDLYRNDPAYVNSQYTDEFDGGSITGSSVNLRTTTELDTNTNIYANVESGTRFIVLDDNVIGDPFSGSTRWYKIEYNGQMLYVHSKLATINSRIARVTANFLNVMADKSTNSHIYATVTKGTVLTILEENNNGWHKVTISSWRNAKTPDVQKNLDSNNFVNDQKLRLQFMNLSKSSGVQEETLNQYLEGKGILAGKGHKFIEASNKHGVNEVYLMSHALLETGNGRSDLANGILVKEVNGEPVVLKDSNGGVLTRGEVESIPEGAKVVYNMYGIGAYDQNPDELGAIRAYENEWFTPEDAIVGGAAFIGTKYLKGENPYNIIQNTLYEMRWNPELMSTSGKAGNQYASDIEWASKQVNHMYEVYKIVPYTIYLEIPVYK